MQKHPGWLGQFARVFFAAFYLLCVMGASFLIYWAIRHFLDSETYLGAARGDNEFVALAMDFTMIGLGITVIAVLYDHLKTLVTELAALVRESDKKTIGEFCNDRVRNGHVLLSVIGITAAALSAKSGADVAQNSERIVSNSTQTTMYDSFGVSEHSLLDEEPFLWRIRFPTGRLISNFGSCKKVVDSDRPEELFQGTSATAEEEFTGRAEDDLDDLTQALTDRINRCESTQGVIALTGFSSEVPFAQCPVESDEINRQLELARARKVESWLKRRLSESSDGKEIQFVTRNSKQSNDLIRPSKANAPSEDLFQSVTVQMKIACLDD